MYFSKQKLKPIHIPQQGESDCGVACLLAVLQHYGGNATLENLRELSGTSIQGTSLLGLQQAATTLHMQADAFEVDDLAVFKAEATFPCILHVLIDQKQEHYVVCYGYSPAGYLVSDPAKGIETWSEEELLARWQSRAVLLLQPTEQFERLPQNNQKKIAWFKTIIKEDTPLLLIAAVLGVVLALLGLATAIFSQKLIDEILPKQQTQRLWLGMALLAILLFARAGIGYLRTFFLLRQSRDFNVRIMNDFYEKLLHLPKTFFDTRKTGDIMARINDTRRIQSVISFLAGNVAIDVLVFLISAGFIFTFSWEIGLITLLGIPLFGLLVWRFNAHIIQNQKEVMSHYANSEANFVDAITGIGVVKATNNEAYFGKVGKAFYQLFQQKVYNLGTTGNKYGLWNEVINTALVVSILSISAWFVLGKQLKLGEMMAVITIASGMIGAVGRLATTNIQIQEAKVAFERMFEFANVKSEYNTNISKNNAKLGGGKFPYHQAFIV